MDYFLFNNEIYVGNGIRVERLEKTSGSGPFLVQSKQAHVCVVDIDVLIASASENALDKKDGILAKKFNETYQGDYVLQDEKIGNNIFQVIGIKVEKVKEVYSSIPSEKVITFVPYAVAVRNFLACQRVAVNQPVVFLDDLGHEKFITVFEGLKFSRTRTIFNDKAEHLLPEIKRSVINFEKKLDDQKDKNTEGYCIVTNNKTLGHEIGEIEKGLTVTVLDSVCPAIDGLKAGGFNLKYILPEEIIRKRRQEEIKNRTQSLSVSALIFGLGIFFYFYNQVGLQLAKKSFMQEQERQLRLEKKLNELDPLVYRNVLKQQKRINYPLVYLEISNALPVTFETYSFSIYNKSHAWIVEEYLCSPDDGAFDNIPSIGLLKRAQIKDFLVNNRPGKYLRIEL